MNSNIAVIRGDGIGPEIVEQAVRVLKRVAKRYGHNFTFTDTDVGGCAIDKYGQCLPEVSLRECLSSDSVLLGPWEVRNGKTPIRATVRKRHCYKSAVCMPTCAPPDCFRSSRPPLRFAPIWPRGAST